MGGAVGELGRLPLGPLPGLLQNPVPGRASPRAQLLAQARPGAACRASLSPVACGPGRARVGPKGRASGRAAGPRAAWPGIVPATPRSVVTFPNLSFLRLDVLSEWEEWDWEEESESETTEAMAMPALKELIILSCKLAHDWMMVLACSTWHAGVRPD